MTERKTPPKPYQPTTPGKPREPMIQPNISPDRPKDRPERIEVVPSVPVPDRDPVPPIKKDG
jgi:hypothetical protein